MSEKLKRLTMERHRQLGERLFNLRSELIDLLHEVSLAEGKNAKATRRCRQLINALDLVRIELENAMYTWHPNEADGDVYYPKPERTTGGTLYIEHKTVGISGTELMKMQFPELIEVHDGEVFFLDNDYSVDLAEIENFHDLLEWVHHLAGKAWIDGEAISQFIEAVCAQKGWKIYGGG